MAYMSNLFDVFWGENPASPCTARNNAFYSTGLLGYHLGNPSTSRESTGILASGVDGHRFGEHPLALFQLYAPVFGNPFLELLEPSTT